MPRNGFMPAASSASCLFVNPTHCVFASFQTIQSAIARPFFYKYDGFVSAPCRSNGKCLRPPVAQRQIASLPA
ncbi:hypothetical protein [Xanthomonas phage vB_XooS_NR08]|nr:hypothetical protein [Xanthomonas phage vB_XooS_NR08]